MNSNEEAPNSSIFYRTLDSAFLPVNKYLIRQIGLQPAAFFSYFAQKDKNDDWIFATRNEIQQDTGLSGAQQRTIIKKLQLLNLIEVTKKGYPLETWYRINFDVLFEIIEKAPERKRSISNDKNR